MNYLILSPSDIFYLTGVRSHDPGEIIVIVQNAKGKGQNEETDSVTPAKAGVYQGNRGWIPAYAGMTEKKGIIFCDPRTSALFDEEKYEIIGNREGWKERFSEFGTLETDPDFLTQTLREKIEGFGVSLTMGKSPITTQRIVKTQTEIEILRESQRLNKEVYQGILPFLIPGVTEEEIERRIQILQLELGASGPSFPPIVAFGENTAIPHHSPTSRKLLPTDIVLLDMGLIYRGYCSDMTRMVIQSDTSPEIQDIAELVTEVTEKIIQWAKPGMKVADIDVEARRLLGEYEPFFTHSLGHGVGIDIHEEPYLSKRSDAILQPGMIVTIEPGVYIAGKYGARYEEMAVVDKDGLRVL